MKDGDLRKIYYPIAESWKLIRKFAEEALAALINEIDRIMKENGGGYYE